MTILVVGRGLLGGTILRELVSRSATVHTVDVAWGRPEQALPALVGAARRAASAEGGWQLVWTAGAGVIATRASDLEAEVATFAGFLEQLPVPPAAMFLASSAGGVYGGSFDAAPFTEHSATGAASDYGRAKLAMESSAIGLSRRGTRVLLGRLANLYGPGQNLSKPQGLVSQLCLTHLTRQPLRVYASMDSLRDYIFVKDAAVKVVDGLELLSGEDEGSTVVKIIASGVSRSVGSVIGESTRAFRKRPNLVIRGAGGQVMDLRMRSTTWQTLERRPVTPFAVGLQATAADIAGQLLRSSLHRGR